VLIKPHAVYTTNIGENVIKLTSFMKRMCFKINRWGDKYYVYYKIDGIFLRTIMNLSVK